MNDNTNPPTENRQGLAEGDTTAPAQHRAHEPSARLAGLDLFAPAPHAPDPFEISTARNHQNSKASSERFWAELLTSRGHNCVALDFGPTSAPPAPEPHDRRAAGTHEEND